MFEIILDNIARLHLKQNTNTTNIYKDKTKQMQRGCDAVALLRFKNTHPVVIYWAPAVCSEDVARDKMHKDPRPSGILPSIQGRDRPVSCLPQGLESDGGLWGHWILSHLFLLYLMRKSFSGRLLSFSLLVLTTCGPSGARSSCCLRRRAIPAC